MNSNEVYVSLLEILISELYGTNSPHQVPAHLQEMTAPEQIVLTLAATIGRTFSCEMLESIIPDTCNNNLIYTLNSLVRKGIIQCAFKSSSTGTCDCKNKKDLPQDSKQHVYPCQLMIFCKMNEMWMIQKLIEKSKRLYQMIHTKCAEYCETKDYCCKKCENKNFAQRHKEDPDINTARVQEIYKTIRPYEAFQISGLHFQNGRFPSTENHGNETENFLSTVKSMVKETRDSIPADSCECAQIVESVLLPRMKHWKAAGNISRTYQDLVEIAAAYVYLRNEAKALECLTEASSILENSSPTDVCSSEQAFVHRLTGEILFRAGKLLEAEVSFKKALRLLNCSPPLTTFTIKNKIRQALSQARCCQMPDKARLGNLQECINCLSFLWQIDCAQGKVTKASAAINMEINLAIRSADPFKILYAAVDYLRYSQFKGKDSKCRQLEEFLCRACARLSDHPEGQKLICHLTQTLAVVKLCTGNLEESIECTRQAWELSEVLHESSFDVRSAAVLYLPLLFSEKYCESVKQINPLEKVGREMASSVAQGWFYAACMNTLLYIGFAVRPFEECLAFVENSQSDKNLRADKSLMLHLNSAVALWYARLGNWKRFLYFYRMANNVYTQTSHSIQSISGMVIFLECIVLVSMQKHIACHRDLPFIRKKKLLTIITRFGENHVFFPRVLHLCAILKQVKGKILEERYLLQVALKLCRKHGNILDEGWIRQSQADWSPTCKDTQKTPRLENTIGLKFHFKKWEEDKRQKEGPNFNTWIKDGAFISGVCMLSPPV